MGWWLTRTLAALLAVVGGALVGALLGWLVQHPLPAMFMGGLVTMALLVLRDSWRGQALMDWLRGPLTAPAPRDAGFWGELGYRIEKALRGREQDTRGEQDRLAQFLSAIEASPNGVMMLDRGDQIEWCNSVAAEHFGLDPSRDRRQRVTNLVRMPAFVAHLQGGQFGRPRDLQRAAGAHHAVGAACGLTATARSWCCRRTSPNANAPTRCGATSWPTCRTRSARR